MIMTTNKAKQKKKKKGYFLKKKRGKYIMHGLKRSLRRQVIKLGLII